MKLRVNHFLCRLVFITFIFLSIQYLSTAETLKLEDENGKSNTVSQELIRLVVSTDFNPPSGNTRKEAMDYGKSFDNKKFEVIEKIEEECSDPELNMKVNDAAYRKMKNPNDAIDVRTFVQNLDRRIERLDLKYFKANSFADSNITEAIRLLEETCNEADNLIRSFATDESFIPFRGGKHETTSKRIKAASSTAMAHFVERHSWKNVHSANYNNLSRKRKGINAFGKELVNKKGELNATNILILYKIGSRLGNETAQFRMGVMYNFGFYDGDKFVDIDLKRSLLNYYFAAVNGDIKAQITLGFKHLNGLGKKIIVFPFTLELIYYSLGVPKSCESAVLYYQEAANSAVSFVEKQGYESIKDFERLSLGPTGPVSVYPTFVSSSFFSGNSDQDIIDYFSNTADKGDINAQFRLGQYYFYGIRGAPRNVGQAMKYFRLAGRNNDGMSLAMLGNIYLNNLHPESDLPEQERYRKAKYYFESAIAAYKESSTNSNLIGSGNGRNGLGYMYLYGFGVEQDLALSYDLFNKAIEQESVEALYNLGTMYLTGVGVRYIDYSKAVKYFNTATKRGHMLSIHKLGIMQLNGIGLKKNCESAVGYFKLVAEKSDEYVETLTAAKKLYASQNVEQALQLYLLGAEMGSELGQNNAAFILDKKIPNIYTRKPNKEPFPSRPQGENVENTPLDESETDAWLIFLFRAAFATLVDIDLYLETLVWNLIWPLNTDELELSPFLDIPNVHEITGSKEALRMLYLAAEQGNVEARVKIGDYFYYDLVDRKSLLTGLENESALEEQTLLAEDSNFEIAAYHYKQAGEAKNSQALFNLGYMYQNGIGLPQDFHLAKRYFDDAKHNNPDANFPVSLALIGLYAHRFGSFVINGGNLNAFPSVVQNFLSFVRNIYLLIYPKTNDDSTEEASHSVDGADEHFEESVQDGSQVNLHEIHEDNLLLDLDAQEIERQSAGIVGYYGQFFSYYEQDTIIAVLLLIALLFVTWFRQHRLNQRRNNLG